MSVATEPIRAFADLEQWAFPGTALAVIGQPVAHSLSPVIHNAALAELAKTQPRFREWRYFKFDLAPDDLPQALALFHRQNFRGLNLTVPHKALVVDQLVSGDAFVRAAGAANTLLHAAGGWRGANTDGAGLSAALRQDLKVDLAGVDVLLLGAGGAARAAAIECLRLRCASLWIGNRTQARLEALLARLEIYTTTTRVHGFDPGRLPPGLPESALVINATSLGLAAGDPSPLDLNAIPKPAWVYDMIYRPAQTALLRQATAAGIPNANGLSMLVHQGARSLELWTEMAAPIQVMQAAARAALGSN